MSVDHQNFPVIPVVVVRGDKRGQRGEHFAFDSKRPETPGIIVGQKGKLTGSVIHHSHINACRRLIRKDFQHPSPHETLVHYKVLHKNKVFRRLELPKHFLKLIFPKRKISHQCFVVHRMASASLHIVGQSRSSFVFPGKPFIYLGRLGNTSLCFLYDLIHAYLERPVPDIALRVDKQKHAEHGQEHDHDQPRYFCRWVNPAVQKINHHPHGEQYGTTEYMGQKFLKPDKNTKQDQNLHDKQQ